jgi:hypothetical protein
MMDATTTTIASSIKMNPSMPADVEGMLEPGLVRG